MGVPLHVSSPQGRAEGSASLVDGSELRAIDPYGKHLFYRFGPKEAQGQRTLHVHLGLFGKFTRSKSPALPPKETVRLRIASPKWTVDLVGPTDCRIVDPDEEFTIRARLGPDPLRPDADPELVWKSLQRRRIPIGEALLDQKVIAGVGNVYRAEALFIVGVHPNRPANQLDRYEFDQIWSTLVRLLNLGVQDKRILTVSDDELATFDRPRRRIPGKEAVYVYKKGHCMRCGSAIERWDMAGRWAYACQTCQPK